MLVPDKTSGETLEPVPLKFAFDGRLRNTSKLSNWKMAVAEAIQNSMDAIEESGIDGSIEVELERHPDLIPQGHKNDPIHNIVIRDTGIGFTDKNFDSFCTPDSLHKIGRGGKGLGRLMCLQAFRRITADSVYIEGDAAKRRSFLFQAEVPQLSAKVGPSLNANPTTVIRLEGLRDEFASKASADQVPVL